MSATVTSPRRVVSDRPRTSTRRRATAARPPRRVSGPAGGRARAAVARRESLPLGGRALALVRGLPDHSLIDRLVRGRAWIPVLGVLLAGIVAMQVEILKLGASMGRAIEQTSTLQSKNESLQASVAGLADDQRIERLAVGMGMAMPTPESLVFLRAHPRGDIGRALANIHIPDPVGFTSALVAQAAAAAALMPTPPPSTTSSTGATTATTSPSVAGSSPVTSPTTAPSTAAPQTPSSSGGSVGTASPALSTQTTTPTAPATSGTGAAGTAAGGAAGTPAGPAPSSGGGGAATGAAGIAPAASQSNSSTGG
ncbi:MAG: hypothetical protein JO244_05445 [Solirubrobacterales bacterium]|nr:hypothetical protein [Solirubrobacterales bacterium]